MNTSRRLFIALGILGTGLLASLTGCTDTEGASEPNHAISWDWQEYRNKGNLLVNFSPNGTLSSENPKIKPYCPGEVPGVLAPGETTTCVISNVRYSPTPTPESSSPRLTVMARR